jgi:nucleoside-triphosphatase THEP1
MSEIASEENTERLPFAAAVYSRATEDRKALATFAAGLRDKGIKVGGLLQEELIDGGGCRMGIDLVDVVSGSRFPINRPTKESVESKACSMNTNVLADSTEALRQAIADRVDLIVLEKFGEQEQGGGGLNDEILNAIAENIPLVIAVPETALELWTERSGGLGSNLNHDVKSLEDWWQEVNPA